MKVHEDFLRELCGPLRPLRSDKERSDLQATTTSRSTL